MWGTLVSVQHSNVQRRSLSSSCAISHAARTNMLLDKDHACFHLQRLCKPDMDRRWYLWRVVRLSRDCAASNKPDCSKSA